MPEQSAVVEYQDDELDVRLTVQRATIRVGIKRTRLQIEAEKIIDDDWGLHVLRRHTYPDLIAATIEAKGISWPLSFGDYLGLPEPLGVAWERAVYELNPHWLPQPAEGVEGKKTNPTNSTDA